MPDGDLRRVRGGRRWPVSDAAVVEVSLAPKSPSTLPEAVVRRGINPAQWNTLCRSLFPGANPSSVLLVWDYCKARQLDPLKKPCHIVPMEVKDAKTGSYEWRDVVMPGIYEYRTTAQRTGEYLGHAKPAYGVLVTAFGVEAPEYCDFTVYRWNALSGQRVEFPVTVYFREVVAVSRDRKSGEVKANSRWTKAPIQMLTKCAEAAALREAFPDELGGEATAEEMDGQRAPDITVQAEPVKPLPVKPEGFDDWRADLSAAAEEGEVVLARAWEESPEDCRIYLVAVQSDALEQLKAKAREPRA
jgi:phage recombination protein Bet